MIVCDAQWVRNERSQKFGWHLEFRQIKSDCTDPRYSWEMVFERFEQGTIFAWPHTSHFLRPTVSMLNQWTLFVFLFFFSSSIIARSRHTKQFRCRCRRAIMISPKTMIYANTSAPYGMIANFSCRHRGPITNSFGYASAVCTMRHLWLVFRFNLITAFEHLVRARRVHEWIVIAYDVRINVWLFNVNELRAIQIEFEFLLVLQLISEYKNEFAHTHNCAE